MPSVKGYSVDSAKKLLDSLGITYNIKGEGQSISEQSIPEGELIQKGNNVTLTVTEELED